MWYDLAIANFNRGRPAYIEVKMNALELHLLTWFEVFVF